MKKRIGVFGGYRFMTIVYENGTFIPVYNYVLNKLNIENNVYNYAKGDMSIKDIAELVKIMIEKEELKDILLSLGEREAGGNPNDILLLREQYQKELENLFVYLKERHINVKVELVADDTEAAKILNTIISDLCHHFSINIINEDIYSFKIIGNRKIKLSSLYI